MLAVNKILMKTGLTYCHFTGFKIKPRKNSKGERSGYLVGHSIYPHISLHQIRNKLYKNRRNVNSSNTQWLIDFISNQVFFLSSAIPVIKFYCFNLAEKIFGNLLLL